MQEKQKCPNYTKEFKQDAGKLVIEQRCSCPAGRRPLGVAASNVTRWVRQYREDQQELNDSGVTRRDLEAENRRLKKENKRLKIMCPFLLDHNTDCGSLRSHNLTLFVRLPASDYPLSGFTCFVFDPSTPLLSTLIRASTKRKYISTLSAIDKAHPLSNNTQSLRSM